MKKECGMAVAIGEEWAKESKKEGGEAGMEIEERREESQKEQEGRKRAEGVTLEAKSWRLDADESP